MKEKDEETKKLKKKEKDEELEQSKKLKKKEKEEKELKKSETKIKKSRISKKQEDSDEEVVKEAVKKEKVKEKEKDKEEEEEEESSDEEFFITNENTVAQIAKYTAPKGWKKVFENAYDELKVISKTLAKREKKIGRSVPDKQNLFRAFHLCPVNKVRVVIIGQDPYQNLKDNGESVAQGCSFSVKKGDPIPPSLKNIFKEILRSYPDCKIGKHGCLEKWCKQGVLLLNVCLTTDVGVSGAHSKFDFWMSFIIYVLEAISEANPQCIYLLWGKDAQKIESYLKKNPIVLSTSHPSPFSVTRGFEGCGHFKKVNKLLDPTKQPKLAKGKTHHWSILEGPIDWSLD